MTKFYFCPTKCEARFNEADIFLLPLHIQYCRSSLHFLDEGLPTIQFILDGEIWHWESDKTFHIYLNLAISNKLIVIVVKMHVITAIPCNPDVRITKQQKARFNVSLSGQLNTSGKSIRLIVRTKRPDNEPWGLYYKTFFRIFRQICQIIRKKFAEKLVKSNGIISKNLKCKHFYSEIWKNPIWISIAHN